LLGGLGTAKADYTFTYNDGTNSGYGTLTTQPSGLKGDTSGSQLATSGSLTLTSGPDAGTYTLYSAGPALVQVAAIDAQVDNLVYPSNNAASGIHGGGFNGGSYLDYFGLLFTNDKLDVSIYGNGSDVDQANIFSSSSSLPYGMNAYSSPSGAFILSSVPEPSGITLLGLGVVCLAGGYVLRKGKVTLAAA
jgi:hypothetical protein